jgi:hypothetical protein
MFATTPCRVVCEMCEQSMSAPTYFHLGENYSMSDGFSDKCFLEFQLRFRKSFLRLREGETLRGSRRQQRQKDEVRQLAKGSVIKNLLIGECKKVRTHKIKSTCQRFD